MNNDYVSNDGPKPPSNDSNESESMTRRNGMEEEPRQRQDGYVQRVRNSIKSNYDAYRKYTSLILLILTVIYLWMTFKRNEYKRVFMSTFILCLLSFNAWINCDLTLQP